MATLVEDMDFKFSQQNFLYFYTTVLGYDKTWFVEQWNELFQNNTRVLIEASRGCGKSSCLRAYVLWFALMNPKTDVIYFSHSRDLAQRHLAQLKLEFDKGFLPRFRPEDKEDWTKQTVRLPNRSTITIGSVGTAMRGVRANIIVNDDLLSDRSNIAMSDITDWYNSVVSNIPTPEKQPAAIYTIGTPLSWNDLYSFLARPDTTYICRKYPAIANDEETKKRYPPESDGYLWKEKRGPEYLEKKKHEVGELAFSREFLLSPISLENAVYPRPLIEKAIEAGEKDSLWYVGEPPPGRYYGGVDLAISETGDADFTVITVVERRDDDKIQVVYLKRGKFNKLRTIDEINIARSKFKLSVINVESNAFQRSFCQDLIQRGVPIREVRTDDKKKHEFAMALRLLMENERLIIPSSPYMETENLSNQRMLVDELANMAFQSTRAGNVTIKGLMKHDDMVISLWMAVDAVKYGTGGFQTIGEAAQMGAPPVIIGSKGWFDSGLNLRLKRWKF